MLEDIFIDNCPKLDLHGETKASARVLINEFIEDNYILKSKKIIIVHGIGTGALKSETHRVLSNNKKVHSFHLNHYNSGCTVVFLNKKI